MRTDRRTVMTKLKVACRKFANAPKKDQPVIMFREIIAVYSDSHFETRKYIL